MNLTQHSLWCTEGHFNQDQAELISKLVKEKNPRFVLETGFCTGRSSVSVLLSSDSIVKFVNLDIDYDYMDPYGRIMREEISKNFKSFISYEVDSNKFLINDYLNREFPEKIDWFTVDGDHSYKGCLNDLEKVLPFMNNGGIIIIDDYKSGPPNGCVIQEVTNACDYFYNKYSSKIKKTEWNVKGKGFCIFEVL